MNKHDLKLKHARHAERLEQKQIHAAAEYAIHSFIPIAMDAACSTFRERASNPKMEEFILKILHAWKKLGDRELSLQTLCDSVEASCKIRYDLKKGDIINLKAKG